MISSRIICTVITLIISLPLSVFPQPLTEHIYTIEFSKPTNINVIESISVSTSESVAWGIISIMCDGEKLPCKISIGKQLHSKSKIINTINITSREKCEVKVYCFHPLGTQIEWELKCRQSGTDPWFLPEETRVSSEK